MADEAKRTGEEPAFDTDRAWDRFEKLAAGEPVPAGWRHAQEGLRSSDAGIESRWDGNSDKDEKDGAKMKMTEASRVTHASPAVVAAGAKGVDGAWRTETPSRRRLRRLTAGVVAAVMAVGLFATSLGDHVLAAMQQTFRIQQLVGVGISADDMSTISNLLERGSPEGDRSFNLAQYGTLTQSGGGETHSVTWDEAERRMDAPLLRLEDSTAPAYQPASTLIFNLNVKAVNRLLTRLGSNTTLPAEADGQAIRLHVPDGITTEGTLAGYPVRLRQFGLPELTVEDGIDAAAVRDAVLGLPVLPDSLRTQLAAIGDWRSTLPVPARDGVTTNLRLGGHDAIMTSGGTNRYLLWLDGNRMSLLIADKTDFPAESAFRQAAEELVRP